MTHTPFTCIQTWTHILHTHTGRELIKRPNNKKRKQNKRKKKKRNKKKTMFFKDSRRLIKSEVIRKMFIDTHTLTHHTDVCKRTQTCSHTHTGRELVKRPPKKRKEKKKNDADWYQTAAAPAVKICRLFLDSACGCWKIRDLWQHLNSDSN